MARLGHVVAAFLYPIAGCALGVVVIGGVGILVAKAGTPAIWASAVVLVIFTAVSMLVSGDLRRLFRRRD